jgi:hypothetical protein
MGETASGTCPECGAPIPAGGTCQENFYALLFLEAEMPGGPGAMAHFYAVASYGLQHPASMKYTVEALEVLRAVVADVLAGTATIADVRQRVGATAKQAGRVTRRNEDRIPRWPIEAWPIVITDVLPGGVAGYAARVERWACSIIAIVAGHHP